MYKVKTGKGKAMSITQLHDTWYKKAEQLWSDHRVTQRRMMLWMLIGLFQAGNIQLSKIAEEIPSQAKLPSVTRRIERFLDNANIHVREWYRPVIEPVVAYIADRTGEIRLIVDGTKVGNRHQLLMVGIAYRSRAIPLVWTWVRCRKGHSSTGKQRALLSYVHDFLPDGVPVLLVGDSEFGHVAILSLLDHWNWSYVLRQKGSYLVQLDADDDSWISFRTVITHPGERRWLPQVRLTQKSAYRTNLLADWAKGESEPWLLATNLHSAQVARRAYRRRAWIENLFGDLKGKGFDLESTRLQHFMRLSRLTLVVAVLHLWFTSTGATVIKNGQRSWVDRNDRRDLSLFQIGLRWIKRRLVNQSSVPIRFKPV
jgi:hypothetical protein